MRRKNEAQRSFAGYQKIPQLVVKEIPGVLSQGSTIEEARENTFDALNDYLEDMRLDNETQNTVLQEELIFQ